MIAKTAEVVVDGLGFPESPRWHGDRLWYVDVAASQVRAVDLREGDELIGQFEGHVSAIEFLPDGSPVVALAEERRIVRLDDRTTYADLSALTNRGSRFTHINDMVVDQGGTLYVGCTMGGRDLDRPDEDLGDAIAVVGPDGRARVGGASAFSPNGLGVSPDGEKLVAAEPGCRRLVSFTITGGGGLTDRRVVAEVEPDMPDGICVDTEGGVWAAGLGTGQAIRVVDGLVTSTVATVGDHWAIAVALGGTAGSLLFVTTCSLPSGRLRSMDDVRQASGFIEVVEVDVPGRVLPSG